MVATTIKSPVQTMKNVKNNKSPGSTKATPKKLIHLTDMPSQIAEKSKMAMNVLDEAFAVAKPQVEPMLKFIQDQHNQHPEVIRLVVASVAVLYGGCFFKLAVLYATWTLVDTQAFVDEVKQLMGRASGDDPKERALDLLKKSDPADFANLLARASTQFCTYFAVLYSSLGTSVALSVYIEDRGSFLRPLIITKLKPMVTTDEMQRWIPFAVQMGSTAFLTAAGLLYPRTLAALMLSYEGGLAVAGYVSEIPTVQPMSEVTIKILGGAMALLGTAWQWLSGFVIDSILGNIIFTFFYPVFVVEALFT